MKFLETIVKYLYQATEIETGRIIKAIEPVTKKGGEIAMTTAERLRQEGRKEGRVAGRPPDRLVPIPREGCGGEARFMKRSKVQG